MKLLMVSRLCRYLVCTKTRPAAFPIDAVKKTRPVYSCPRHKNVIPLTRQMNKLRGQLQTKSLTCISLPPAVYVTRSSYNKCKIKYYQAFKNKLCILVLQSKTAPRMSALRGDNLCLFPSVHTKQHSHHSDVMARPTDENTQLKQHQITQTHQKSAARGGDKHTSYISLHPVAMQPGNPHVLP